MLTLIFGFCVIHSLRQLDNWLVVDSDPTNANAIVVLGGGGGSRLHKGIDLYEQGFSNHLFSIRKVKTFAFQANRFISNVILKEWIIAMAVIQFTTSNIILFG